MAGIRPAPPIASELIDWLLCIFPDRIPDSASDSDDIKVRIGEQRVIRKLAAELRRQNHNVLETR